MSVIRDLFTSSVNSTMMSINERFTYLQKNARPAQTTVMTIRANNAAAQQASAKNRRLAMQMERRLSAMAALKIKKKSIRQRLGVPLYVAGQGSSVRDRLTLPGRGRARGKNATKRGVGNRGRSLTRRSQNLPGGGSGGGLQRSRSMQSLSNAAVARRSRSRSRTRNRTPSRGPKENPAGGPAATGVGGGGRGAAAVARRRRSASAIRQGRLKKTISNTRFLRQQSLPPTTQRRKRSNSVSFRNRKAKALGRGGNNQGLASKQEARRGMFKRGGGGGRNGFAGSQRGGGQGGGFRGRGGRGRGRGGARARNPPRGNRQAKPTKEDLDKELEQYMANTKSQLDKDIDTYMKESAGGDGIEMWD